MNDATRTRTRPRVSSTAPSPKDRSEPHHEKHIFLRDVPKSTHKAFKSACAEKDITMRDGQIILMRRFAMAVKAGENTIRIDKMKPDEADEDTAE